MVISGTSGSNTCADAVGMTTMGAVPARVVAECVLDAADPKPPFPGELAVGFRGNAVGMTMGTVPARAAAERVLNAADPKPPFPGELTVGFPGKLMAPTAALTVPATAVAIGVLGELAVPATAVVMGVLLAVDSGMEKKGWRQGG